jgi:hypothetical protein
MIGSGANYNIYGANIASHAGETGELLFTASGPNAGLLDSIQFSSSSVPEPSEFVLTALGTFLLGLFHKRNSFIRR